MIKEFRGESGDIAKTLTEQHDNMQSMIAAQNLRAVACGLYAPAGQQPIDKAWAAVLPPLKETDK